MIFRNHSDGDFGEETFHTFTNVENSCSAYILQTDKIFRILQLIESKKNSGYLKQDPFVTS